MKNNVEANLKFIVPQQTKPFFESSEYTGSVPKIHFKTEYKSVEILDIRDKKDQFQFEKNGFELLDHKTTVKDFYNHNEVKNVYAKELKNLLIKRFNASEVFIFDYTRRSDGSQGAKNPDGLRGPADRVHADYTDLSGPQRTKEAIDAIEKKEWSKACKAMLDYYDRCYEYELEKTKNINSIDLSGLNLKSSLIKILKEKLNPL